jgi:hypothetical protein
MESAGPPADAAYQNRSAAVVSRLNSKYENGRPSNNMEAVGLLVHTLPGRSSRGWDTEMCAQLPVWMCVNHHHRGPRWLPSAASIRPGAARWDDRVAASVINAQQPATANDAYGFVVNASAVELLCAFHGDGTTDARWCDPPGRSERCIPGCWAQAGLGDGMRAWCASNAQHEPPKEMCAWKREDLKEMLATNLAQAQSRTQSYNEVVVDAAPWVRNMPHTIEAIFFIDKADRAVCLALQLEFQKMYRLASHQLPPVVKYRRRARAHPAFVVAPTATSRLARVGRAHPGHTGL